MKHFLLFLLIFALIGCDSDSNPLSQDPASNDNLVAVQFDFQGGFAGQFIDLDINEKDIFSAFFSNVSSFTGPEAMMVTYLPRGQNRLRIFRRENGDEQNTANLSVDVNLGNARKYFIGLNIRGDKLNAVVQDTVFLYL
ncbi:MAG: hypothetical protein ACE5HS_18705 [bacterium]